MSENRCTGRASKRNMPSRKGNYSSIDSHNSHDLNYGKQELLDNLKIFFEKNDYNSMEDIVIELIEERNKLSRKLEAINASDLGESKCMPKFTCEFSEIFDKVNSLSMEKYFLEMENKRLQGEVKELHDLNIKRLEPLLEKAIKCPHCHSTFKYSFDEDERFNSERFERMSKTFNKGINTSTGNICYIPVMENGQMTTTKKSSIDEDINDGKRVTEEWLKKIKHSQKSTKPYHMLISDRQRKNRNIKMLKAMYKANAGNKIDPETIDYIISETGYEGQLKFTISIEELSPIIMHHKFSNRGLFALKALIDGKAGWKVFPTRQQIAGVRADTSENPLNSKLSSPVDDDQAEFSKTSKDLTDESNESSKTVETIKNEEA
uniref:Mnd1 domain-containing protein n=1 Tax=Strongyloides papillosus TaxID=174720 RepID=A0A0N5BB91_STREA